MRFWKMHGAGNDFVMVDDRNGGFPVEDSDWISAISSRRRGVGCEGVILIQESDEADFRMRFFNPDGGEVEMCGNGLRCVARLANEIGVAGRTMSIDTVAGLQRAEVLGEDVRIFLSTPTDWRIKRELTLDDGTKQEYSYVNSGVPHAVIEVDDLDGYDVHRVGAGVRYHADFAPAGTNANFISVTGPQALSIRTYERGVEAESGACGTGIVASALIAGRLGKVTSPVTVSVVGGDVLEVGFKLTDDAADVVSLLGPTVHVYRGEIVYGK